MSEPDPPGLDAAIEAAQLAFCARMRWPLVVGGEELVALKDAIRAAAPALRAGALTEAADGWTGLGSDAEVPAHEFADWLRERADRIGGAT